MEPYRPPTKMKPGWTIAGIVLLALAALLALSALTALVSQDSEGDLARQFGRVTALVLVPGVPAVLGVLCLRKSRRP